MRKFIITYIPIKKYGVNLKQNATVTINNETGNIGVDAKSALNSFINVFGSLKKNEVFSIQEIDENGNSIGEPILPTGDVATVPYMRKTNKY